MHFQFLIFAFFYVTVCKDEFLICIFYLQRKKKLFFDIF